MLSARSRNHMVEEQVHLRNATPVRGGDCFGTLNVRKASITLRVAFVHLIALQALEQTLVSHALRSHTDAQLEHHYNALLNSR